jgi:hypothetical protein
MFKKIDIIHRNLLHYKYVCITDGDITFEDRSFYDYLKEQIGTNDMLVQSEGDHIKAFCAGFMFIKSTEQTRSIFNPENIKLCEEEHLINDQFYLNHICKNLKFKKLPLHLFPTGEYYYNTVVQSPYLIHFNWVIGHEKESRMKHYGKWYITI